MSKKYVKKTEIIEKEDIVQAVVIADNFSTAFAPLSQEIPVALLPLVNVPIIDYTLECLSLAGVNEVFLFCCTHVEQIKAHIKQSIENLASWTITTTVSIIISESCRSVGDAIRDLDAKGVIRGDFILLGANTVANIKLLPILQKHKQIRKKDKGAVMTLIYKEAVPGKKGRCPYDDLVLVSNKETNKVLFHQKIGQASKIALPLEMFLDNAAVEVHYNLQDIYISICSQDVLPLFSDNFDFQNRDDFVKGLLMNEEILNSTIYWHLVEDYGACVSNWYMYQTVSHAVIHRWVFPFVIDMGISNQEQVYMYLRNNIYRNKNVKLEKGSSLIEDVVISDGSTVAEKTTIARSVIGKNCSIGKNVKISDSFIMNNVIIGDDCNISFSIIGSNSNINNNVTLADSCILGTSVQLKKDLKLTGALIQSKKPSKIAPKDIINDHAYRVHSYTEEEDINSEDEKAIKLMSSLHIQLEDSDYEIDESTESEGEMSHMASPIPDDTNLFLAEVIDSLSRGFEDKLDCDNLILEINSSRYAYNVTLKEVNYNVIKAILSLPFQTHKDGLYLQSLNLILKYFAPILMNYVKNEHSMADCLQGIEDVAGTCAELLKCVSKVLHWFYDKDILTEEAIFIWFKQLDIESRLYAQVQPLITWLQQSEESDADEE